MERHDDEPIGASTSGRWPVDPELAEILTLLPESDLTDVAAARAMFDSLLEQWGVVADVSALEVHDRTVPGYGHDPEVLVRVYRPRGAAPDGGRPALLYIHGGGFVIGSVAAEHAAAAGLADELGVVVVSVEYRLAPEHPFPAALHDCYAALVWLASEVDALGVDRERIAVFGQSAGGGLAAAVALFARDQGGPPLCFQFLGIPELDDRLDTPSMVAFVDTPLWCRPNAERSWQYYLGGDGGATGAGGTEVSPYAAPARATDLRGLPPAYVSTMELDPLRDEGILYALRMLQAGVSVELHQFPGTFHGSSVVAHAEVSRRQAAEQLAVLRRRLAIS